MCGLPSSVFVDTSVVTALAAGGVCGTDTVCIRVVVALAGAVVVGCGCGMVGCGAGEDIVVVVTGTELLIIHFSPPSCFMCCTVCGVNVIVCETIGCGCD